MATCPCDDRSFPPVPDIPAGLDRLPRQLATFGAFRLALLDGIDEKAALADWRARGGDDFGVMILEWWAYVLDVLAFYSGEIANESYLRTAMRDASVRRLTDLIGYVPKPALASSATLALFAGGGQPVAVAAGTAFRSDAFGEEAPQVFETGAPALAEPSRNAWTVAPLRAAAYGAGPLLLAADSAAVRAGQLVVVRLPTGMLHAGRVASVEEVTLLDGETYVQLALDPAPTIPSATPLAGIGLRTLALSASLNPFAGSGAVSMSGGQVRLLLDALYSQIRVGDIVAVEDTEGARSHAATVSAVTIVEQALGAPSTGGGGGGGAFGEFRTLEGSGPGAGPVLAEAAAGLSIGAASTAPRAPFTAVTLGGTAPGWLPGAAAGALTLHFRAIPAGRVTRAAQTRIGLADLQGGAALAGPVEPLRQPTTGRVLLRDALDAGASLAGNVTDDGAGAGTLTPLATAAGFGTLRTPVEAHGNLVEVTRGETVEEVLGTGDATRPFQTFRLRKAPLTYLSAPGTPLGRASTLEIRVDGSRWTEVASLFGTGDADRVYTVRRTVDDAFEVAFGGLGTGQPLPTGATVTARYRFGAGAASPPAGAIRQLARPVQGLRRAVNPLAAFGGDDGDDPAAIRTAAPASALSLGRAISLIDFEAIARGYRGILNAAARMDWAEREQRAAVRVWFIPPTPDEASQLRADLEAHLVAVSAPGTPISVAVAVPVPVALSIDIGAAPDREAATVHAAANAALAAFLDPAAIPIGAPLFRADILARLRAVDGVETVRGLFAGGAPAPVAFEVLEGEYVDATLVSPV